jgi:hypothetical protein
LHRYAVALKRELITGWERITREGKLVALPRATTVADTLGRYEVGLYNFANPVDP